MEKEIRALEEAWYSHHRDGPPEEAYALLHDNFLGWPAVDSSVVDKDGLIEFIKAEDANVESFRFEFQDPFGVQVIGNTAINHYRIRFTVRNLDGSESDETLNVTHTWIKENSEWKLFSGMAYVA